MTVFSLINGRVFEFSLHIKERLQGSEGKKDWVSLSGLGALFTIRERPAKPSETGQLSDLSGLKTKLFYVLLAYNYGHSYFFSFVFLFEKGLNNIFQPLI